MGKSDTYFMDDISVWTNPANSNIYPNYLMGDLGQMSTKDTSGTNWQSGMARTNRDPSDPWFGAVFAKSFGDAKSGNRYPQATIGGAFNRDDEMMKYLDRDTAIFAKDSQSIKMDGMLGLALSNGAMLGVKGYVGGGDWQTGSAEKGAWLMRYTLGLNIPVTQGIDFELSGGLNNFDYTWKDASGKDSLGDRDYGMGYDVRARAFFSVPAISGEVVPAVSYVYAHPLDNKVTDLKAGLGVNVSMDRGFFWLGLDYVYTQEKHAVAAYDSTSYGARFSFGIERNVWTDWLVLRVGGMKYMTYTDVKHSTYNASGYTSNPLNDGSANDNVGFGIGLNIEDKLKIDATMGEDIPFTGGGLLSGSTDHIFSRISATDRKSVV